MHLSKSLVRSKCRSILADTRRIQKILRGYSYEHLATDEERLTLCERYLERVVNRAIDVNYHLIRANGESPPSDLPNHFFGLVNSKSFLQNLPLRSHQAQAQGISSCTNTTIWTYTFSIQP